ncbi:PTBP1-like protein, partial [Mya arenaria]
VYFQRGSEELMSHSPMLTTNGTGHSPSQNEVNDAKKVKLENSHTTNMTPSKVIHLRSLPNDVSDSEVVQLGIPFGKMSNVLLLKQKNQAFLEFEDEGLATTFVNYYTKMPCQIRGKQNQASQAALQAAQQAVMGNGDGEAVKKTVLRVIVENLVYPVTIEVLSQSLDGQNIYNGCCTLRIDYSKLNQLNVRYNNDKSRDFTNPSLPTGDPGLDQAMAFGGGVRRGSDVGIAGDAPASILGSGWILMADLLHAGKTLSKKKGDICSLLLKCKCFIKENSLAGNETCSSMLFCFHSEEKWLSEVT